MILRTSLALLMLSTCVLALSQNERPVFKGGVDLVQLDVSVLDGRRVPVRGLTAADFTVLEDGKPRPVRAFAAVDLPRPSTDTDAAWVNSVPADVATNQVGTQDGRLVIILMDRSIPPEEPTVAAKRAARAAIDALGPHDLAALVSTGDGMPQNLTADKSRLIKALGQRDWSTGLTPEQQDVPEIGKDDPLSDGRCLCGLCVLDTITRIADAVRDAPRRAKLLLFIGSNLIIQVGPRDPKADVGCDRLVRDARAKMFDALAVSRLTIDSIDPRGVVNVGPQTRAGLSGRSPAYDTSEAYRRQLQQDATNDLLGSQGALQVLPDRTGGRAILNTNAPEAKVPELFRESETYYVLGFEPAPPLRSGERRSIEVRVNRKDARVFAQRQYLLPAATSRVTPGASPPAEMETSMEGALGGLLPAGGTPLDLAVAAFAGTDSDEAHVLVNVGAAGFLGARASAIPLDVAVSVVDQTGRPVASVRQRSTIETPPLADRRAVTADVATRLMLPAGDYEVRAAVADTETRAVASVFKQIVVPPFATAPLSLSDVAVEMTGASPVTYPQVTLAIAPTTRREFTHADHVAAFLQVYQGTRRTDAMLPVPVRARILDAHGGVAQDQTLTLTAMEFHDRRADCRITLPVERLAPGSYLLQLDASLAGKTATRTVRFVEQ